MDTPHARSPLTRAFLLSPNFHRFVIAPSQSVLSILPVDKASLHFPGTDIESPDIVIVRDGQRYRLLHGHLRLANVLRFTPYIEVEIRGEGRARVMKSAIGYVVATGTPAVQLPLYPD